MLPEVWQKDARLFYLDPPVEYKLAFGDEKPLTRFVAVVHSGITSFGTASLVVVSESVMIGEAIMLAEGDNYRRMFAKLGYEVLEDDEP